MLATHLGQMRHAFAQALLALSLLVAGLALSCGQTAHPPPQPGVGPSAHVACDLYAATGGSDSAPGSRSRPVRTAPGLVTALHPGQTGCFRGGSYTFSLLKLTTPGITLSVYGDEAVTLQGEIKILPPAAGAAVAGMTLNGAGGKHEIGPRIYADSVVLRDNEITNEHTGICVQLSRYYDDPPPRGVVIERNRIHDCGVLPANNHEHGIYIASAQGTIIRDNWIYDNADRGIQLYPDAQRTKVVGNVIDSNGQGVNFGGDDSGQCSNNNLVQGNVIANSNIRWNVYSGAQGPDCTGNVLRDNCVHASNSDDYYNSNGGVEPRSRSFSASENVIANPRFVDAAVGDYTLSPQSPCPLARQADRSALSGS
jgi:parallel beta-helix repeat protein